MPGSAEFRPGAGSAAMANNVASALCYALGVITGILFLVLAPYNQNRVVRFHAFQSIFLNIATIVLSWALGIVFGVLHFLGVVPFLVPLIWLGYFVLWLYLMFSAYQGRKVVLPVIGPLADQQA